MARPRIAALLVFAVVGPVLLLASSAYGDNGPASDSPEIAFTSTGTIPVVCSTMPNVSSLTVKAGTRIFFANLTGTTASIDLGGKDPLTLADGTGAVVMLRLGQYDLRMVPDCVVVDEAQPVTVYVVPGAPPSASPSPAPSPSSSNPTPGQAGPASAPPAGPPGTTVTAGPTASGSGASSGGLVAPTWGSSGGGQPSATAAGPGGGPDTNAVANDSPLTESRVLEVRPVPFGPTNDPKGSRLLALIATICVFGVTAAIIRAILSQRTTRAVNT
jgi:hypothetical protein